MHATADRREAGNTGFPPFPLPPLTVLENYQHPRALSCIAGAGELLQASAAARIRDTPTNNSSAYGVMMQMPARATSSPTAGRSASRAPPGDDPEEPRPGQAPPSPRSWIPLRHIRRQRPPCSHQEPIRPKANANKPLVDTAPVSPVFFYYFFIHIYIHRAPKGSN